METKYDLTWICDHLEKNWILEQPELFIELVQYMKSELDRRKEIISILKNTIEDIL